MTRATDRGAARDVRRPPSGDRKPKTLARNAGSAPWRRLPRLSTAVRGLCLLVPLTLAGCQESEGDGLANASVPQEPVRAVQTVVAIEQEPFRIRAFPSVLQPPEITRLSFEVGGRIGEVNLSIGEEVEEGQALLGIDPRDFELRLAEAEAKLAEAQSALENAEAEADRQITLFERTVVSEAARDRAVTQLEQAKARVRQAERNVDLTRESRGDTTLEAPFDGVINSLEVQDFANVQAGQAVLTLFEENGLQARILVSYDVVAQVSVGDRVTVRPADRPSDTFAAEVTEVARRAEAVSAFPIVVSLEDPAPYLRSGMAVEVLVKLPVAPERRGVVLPMTALATHLLDDLEPAGAGPERRAKVFVFDDATSTVTLREVTVAGASDEGLLVVDGLKDGERVVTAGVPFLRDGQKVALWDGLDA